MNLTLLPWVIQSFLTFDCINRILKCDLKLLSSTSLWCCLFFSFTQFVILENLSILDLTLSGVIVNGDQQSDKDDCYNIIILHKYSNNYFRYPWGEEAFEKAKQKDRPIFLSGEFLN